MSLIYDALKRAELKRKSTQSQDTPNQGEASANGENVVLADINRENSLAVSSISAEQISSDEVSIEQQQSKQSNAEEFDCIYELDAEHAEGIEDSIILALKNRNLISDVDLSKVQRMHEEKTDISLMSLVSRMGIVGDTDIATVYAAVLNIPIAYKDSFPQENVASEYVSERFLKEQKVMPLAIDEDHITIAMSDPMDIESQEAIAMACDREVNLRNWHCF